MNDFDWLVEAYDAADDFDEFADLAGFDTRDPLAIAGEIIYRWDTDRRIIAKDPLKFVSDHGDAHHYQPDAIIDIDTIGYGIGQASAAETDEERGVALGIIAAAYDDLIAGVK